MLLKSMCIVRAQQRLSDVTETATCYIVFQTKHLFLYDLL